MQSQDLINGLCEKIDAVLSAVIPPGVDCALLEFPNYANVGDSAIWLAERKWLAKNGNTVVYSCDKESYSAQALARQVGTGPILLQGGGNFGDIWIDFQRFREQVIQDFPNNKIIQFPQSIHFTNEKNLASTQCILNAHPDLTLLCRDLDSFQFARNNFAVKSILCPDIVFNLGPLPRPAEPTTQILWLARTDKETVNQPLPEDLPGLKRTDWIEEPKLEGLERYQQLTQKIRLNMQGGDEFLPQLLETYDTLAEERLARGCSILGCGEVVVTDRLHGHVVCLLMDIPHIVMNNAYGKVRGLFDAWTSQSELCLWAHSTKEALSLIQNHQFLDLLDRKNVNTGQLKAVADHLTRLVNEWKTVDEEVAKKWSLGLRSLEQDINSAISEGSRFLLVDDNLLSSEMTNVNALPFIEKEGVYWGAPENSEAAIRELEKTRSEKQVNHIAFTWPAFWWLDHYTAFHIHLQNNYECMVENERLVLFRAKEPAVH
jgi:pyruvyl transferase EpsO